jgi:hypothetical protein
MTAATTTYENENLVVHVRRHGHEASVAWTGESDGRSPGDFLNPLMTRLVKDFTGLQVTIDFSGLTYMNSATVAPLIMCIKAFDGAAESVLVIFSDMDWQRTHVQCVRTISRTLKKVKIEVKAALKPGSTSLT